MAVGEQVDNEVEFDVASVHTSSVQGVVSPHVGVDEYESSGWSRIAYLELSRIILIPQNIMFFCLLNN